MARFLSPVARSDSKTSSSTVRGRPAKADSPSRTRANCSSRVAPPTRVVVTIAPALTIGLWARIVTSSRLIVLNGSPVGSAPTFASTASAPLSARARA